MQLGIGKTLFPSWSAAVTLVKDHGIGAATHARQAIQAGDGASRLDHAVRAMTDFDHAIDNTRKLPVDWFVPRAKLYYRGYEAAKQAVSLLVDSGLIPGAKERVGRQSLNAAKETFLAGIDAQRSERGRYGMHLAAGWLEATAEDAIEAVRLLESGVVGRELLAGINQVRTAVLQRRPLDAGLVRTVGDLFDRAGAELDRKVDAAQGIHPVEGGSFAMHRSAQLLAEVEAAARVLATDVEAAAAAHAG